MYRARHLTVTTAAWLVTLLTALTSLPASADQVVDFDLEFDFQSVRTFAFRESSIGIDRPEIRNQLVQQQITDSLRESLLGRGLRESASGADVLVDWKVSGQRYAVNEWGHAIALDIVPGERRPPRGNPWRDLPESFVEGVLVIDLIAQSSNELVWRGVFRNRESSTGKLAQRVPAYGRKLIAEYPRRKR